MEILKSRRIIWADHVWRAKGQTMNNIKCNLKPGKKRPKGRSRQQWIDRIRENLKLLGIKNGEQLATKERYGEV